MSKMSDLNHQQSSGSLFLDPDCEPARRAFRAKPRAMTDKVMSVTEAVERLVKDGDYLGSGGFGGDRIATAVLHEILRQRKRNLGLAGHTATHDFQILCAGNMPSPPLKKGRAGGGSTGQQNPQSSNLLSRVDAAYIVGLEARGLSPHARRVMQSGEVEVCEWTNYTLAVRLQAAAMGVPFLPVRTMLGTDTFKHSAARLMECPFTGQKLAAVPALSPAVAVIHVHESDHYGNCRIRGTTVADAHLARASKKVIVTCERLIPNDEIRRDPTATTIPYYCIDAVCEVPYGSYPGNMPYEYFSDEVHLRAWLEAERDLDTFRAFLDKYIHGTRDFCEYLQLCGGLPRLQELRRQELLL
jgi:glutaconate CoA-transferase subunit A